MGVCRWDGRGHVKHLKQGPEDQLDKLIMLYLFLNEHINVAVPDFEAGTK